MSDPALSTVLEAILFGAGRSMSLEEFSEMLGEPKGVIHVGLSTLRKEMDQREGTALQITDVSGRWILEVRPEMSAFLPETFRADIPARLLPAAALIAYHQPMQQSQLKDMLGQKAYDHVRDLAAMGLIDRRREGLTRRLTTTRRFAEYFGCPEVEYRKVRAWFRSEADKQGLTSAELAASLAPEEQMTISEFSDEEAKGAEAGTEE